MLLLLGATSAPPCLFTEPCTRFRHSAAENQPFAKATTLVTLPRMSNARLFVLVFAPAASSLAIADPPKPLVDFPHPLITEVLFNVPREGDANGDGARQVGGDEFIELTNPHDQAISLKGYALLDRNEPDKGQFKFVFPDLTLEPGQVAVVFNGCDQEWAGGIGDTETIPKRGLDGFGGAFVFTARCKSGMCSFANDGDFVMLVAPKGAPVHAITWGDSDPPPPKATPLIAPAGAASSASR
jgi:hypothetical protein